ncbi:cytochrome c oxidase assembly factor 7 homolog [Prorops nasuta]
MKKGCELNDDSGCFQAGVVALSDRDNGVKDEAERVKEGVKFFEKCCYEFNNDRGCFQLSEIYLHGVEPHIQATPEKALKISENCCELGNAYACRNLAVMYRDGYGVPTDKKMFKKYKERAMDLVKQAQALRRETIFLQKKS